MSTYPTGRLLGLRIALIVGGALVLITALALGSAAVATGSAVALVLLGALDATYVVALRRTAASDIGYSGASVALVVLAINLAIDEDVPALHVGTWVALVAFALEVLVVVVLGRRQRRDRDRRRAAAEIR